MAETVLVTGASGYIASHCIKQLLEGGNYKVRGTVRNLKNEERINALRNIVPDAKFPLELAEAELQSAQCWRDAVKGCSYVLHIASPFPAEEPQNESEIIKPAVDGVRNVLSACAVVGGIKRVVLTSSCGAILPGHLNQQEPINESFWADLEVCGAYNKSKTLAEKTAWHFVNNLPEGKEFELAVINPTFVVGPLILNKPGTSAITIRKFLHKELPLIPNISVGGIDVRDVALAHIIAMTLPEAAGNRHILGVPLSFTDIAHALSDEFKSHGYNPPTKIAPKFFLRIFSWFDAQAKLSLQYVEKIHWKLANDRMIQILGIKPRDLKESVVEMGHSLIELGIVKRKRKYCGKAEQKAESAKEKQAEFSGK